MASKRSRQLRDEIRTVAVPQMLRVHRIGAEIVPLRLDQVNACVGNVLPLLSPPLWTFHIARSIPPPSPTHSFALPLDGPH